MNMLKPIIGNGIYEGKYILSAPADEIFKLVVQVELPRAKRFATIICEECEGAAENKYVFKREENCLDCYSKYSRLQKYGG